MADFRLITDEDNKILHCELKLSVLEVLSIKRALRIGIEKGELKEIDRQDMIRLFTEI